MKKIFLATLMSITTSTSLMASGEQHSQGSENTPGQNVQQESAQQGDLQQEENYSLDDYLLYIYEGLGYAGYYALDEVLWYCRYLVPDEDSREIFPTKQLELAKELKEEDRELLKKAIKAIRELFEVEEKIAARHGYDVQQQEQTE